MFTAVQTETGQEGQRSQTGWAYSVIRGDIIAGRHPPNKKMKIQDLAAELKVSPGAVREALSRLVPEQLVISREQRGFIVAPLSITDLEDLTALRCEIEAIALRQSVVKGDLRWEANLVAAAHRLRSGVKAGGNGDRASIEEWRDSHAAFHAALIGGCGSQRLIALHAQLYEQSERYRMLSVYVEPKRNVTGEHQEIVDVALKRNADKLVDVAVSHIRRTTDLIVKAAAKQGLLEA
ncbi:GntR family transcriptional regulator [Niveispirillum sp.]|uniref:GntR family transcriptional regulator n=1 Tax=Niveispirillum sp. TaxID=1917217 RepID=UPI001B623397|nr:FCD domain-containing protein [Niveispirillum sp.]MBP7338615.1 FCD domain-containing protein [Niveispirillum sp.]